MTFNERQWGLLIIGMATKSETLQSSHVYNSGYDLLILRRAWIFP
ncbi:hypothetical protein [Flavobacterium glaciei]|nr:hypothetical protein [Flavobacterium glaciei]